MAHRRENAQCYRCAFANLKRVQLLKEEHDCSSAYWLFTLLVDDHVDLIRHLGERRIAASIVHRRNDYYSLFRQDQHLSLLGLN